MGLVVGEVTSATASETSRSTPRSWRDGIILCRLYCPQASRWSVSLCVSVRIPPPIVLLMETQPNPAFDEPFVSWTCLYLKGRRASLFFVRTTLMATLLHTAHVLFVFGGKSKKKKDRKKKKEEKRSPSHRNAPSPVGRDAFLFISTHVHHINQNLSLTASLSS